MLLPGLASLPCLAWPPSSSLAWPPSPPWPGSQTRPGKPARQASQAGQPGRPTRQASQAGQPARPARARDVLCCVAPSPPFRGRGPYGGPASTKTHPSWRVKSELRLPQWLLSFAHEHRHTQSLRVGFGCALVLRHTSNKQRKGRPLERVDYFPSGCDTYYP